MRHKISPIQSLLVFETAGMVFLLLLILFSTIIPSKQDFFAQPVLASANKNNLLLPVAEKIGQGLPVRLEIPKIKVNAVIDYVGLTAQGAMGIPTRPARAAWFKFGARPGEIGSAVISGHVNWYNGAYSIFANLNKLKTGDKIMIRDDSGAVISFVVRRSVFYAANQDATDIFNANDGLVHLNLITCSGIWDKKAKQYSNRLVVFTDKE
jgi:LPXTG-site transpeptidase (sortase) family protein